MQAVIDRVEGDTAVLLFEESGLIVNVPLVLLPASSKEGDWLNVHFRADTGKTSAMLSKNKKLLEKLMKKGKP